MTATAEAPIFRHINEELSPVAEHVADMLREFDQDCYDRTPYQVAERIVEAVSGIDSKMRRAMCVSGNVHEERAMLICPMLITAKHYREYGAYEAIAKLIVCALVGAGLPVSDSFSPADDD